MRYAPAPSLDTGFWNLALPACLPLVGCFRPAVASFLFVRFSPRAGNAGPNGRDKTLYHHTVRMNSRPFCLEHQSPLKQTNRRMHSGQQRILAWSRVKRKAEQQQQLIPKLNRSPYLHVPHVHCTPILYPHETKPAFPCYTLIHPQPC